MLRLLGYTSDTHQLYFKFTCSLSALPAYALNSIYSMHPEQQICPYSAAISISAPYIYYDQVPEDLNDILVA